MAWGFFKRRDKREKTKDAFASAPSAEAPAIEPKAPVEVANLQLLGDREQQQDAFFISPLVLYDESGLLALLCDGMGGMAQGGQIAAEVIAALRDAGIADMQPEDIAALLYNISRSVFERYRGQGGTTLLLAYAKRGVLWFYSVGDSDLFLLRNGELYATNQRQEYESELLLRALHDGSPVELAFTNPQHGALSHYIGAERIECDCLKRPFPLRDGDNLLLCSDGISDTLTLAQLQAALREKPQQACDIMQRAIEAAQKAGQDNATAIIIRFNEITTDGGEKQ